LTAIPLIAGLGFLILLLINRAIDQKIMADLSVVQNKYIPFIESGPLVIGRFDRVKRDLQDAVASRDSDTLKGTRALFGQFEESLSKVSLGSDSKKVEAAKQAASSYYSAAYRVSRRLMSGETGVGIVAAMKSMQSKQLEAETLIKEVTAFDQKTLAAVFSEIDQNQRSAAHLQRGVVVFCLIFVTVFALWIGRGVLRSISLLSIGLGRFGVGDFTQPIKGQGHDELGEVADRANEMALRIKTLMEELGSFSYSVAHDLRAPVRTIQGFGKMVLDDHGPSLPEEGRKALSRVVAGGEKMGLLIDGLLSLSQITRKEIVKTKTDLSSIATMVFTALQESDSNRNVQWTIAPGCIAQGDPGLIQVILTNLLGNAWKFTKKKPSAQIEFGQTLKEGKTTFFVKDNGAGFDMKYTNKLFGTFQRLHSTTEFEGTGIGLATVQRVVQRHGGQIWAESVIDQGTTFFFTL
jgi:signal transduction histidine kinase